MSRQTTMERRRAEGICVWCGINDPVPGYRGCDPCMETHAEKCIERYRGRRDAGLCVRCRRPVEPGKAKCSHHLELDRRRKTPHGFRMMTK